MPYETTKVLDHGYIRLIECWGTGEAGVEQTLNPLLYQKPDYECGIIEAARQSTQGSFRHWEDLPCPECRGTKTVEDYSKIPEGITVDCPTCRERVAIDVEGNDVYESTGIERGDERLLRFLYNNKPQHSTPFEFGGMTIEVQAPIFVYREWHRHRTQSYNEMSARYSPLPDLDYTPEWDNLRERGEAATKNKQAQGIVPFDPAKAASWWGKLPQVAQYLEDFYQEGLAAGVPKEMARIKLPVGRYSRMRASGNLRNWLAFCTLRSDKGAMWEIRQYSVAVETLLRQNFPRTYDLFLKRREKS